MNPNRASKSPTTKPVPEPVIAGIARSFRKFGYEGASMSALSEATGLGRSSLYHHFPRGKEEMAHAALDGVERFLRDDMSAVLNDQKSWTKRRAEVLKLLNRYYENGQLGCLLGSFSLQDTPKSVSARVENLIEYWIDVLTAFLAEVGVKDAKQQAEHLVAVIQGTLIISAAKRDKAHFQHTMERSFAPFNLARESEVEN